MSIIITTRAKLIFFRTIKSFRIIKQRKGFKKKTNLVRLTKDLNKIIDSKMKEWGRREYRALM
jgi:hypothetical protein